MSIDEGSPKENVKEEAFERSATQNVLRTCKFANLNYIVNNSSKICHLLVFVRYIFFIFTPLYVLLSFSKMIRTTTENTN